MTPWRRLRIFERKSVITFKKSIMEQPVKKQGFSVRRNRKRKQRSENQDTVSTARQRKATVVFGNRFDVVCDVITFALSIDHILENVMSCISKMKDLLTCRCVCRRWNYFTNPKLQRMIALTFRDFQLKRYPKKRHLNELSNLLKTSSSSYFPCCKFSFSTEYPRLCNDFLSDKNNTIIPFLKIHGEHVEQLKLHFYCNQTTELTELQLMKDMQNILINLAPNLHTLTLDVHFLIPSTRRRTPIGDRILRSDLQRYALTSTKKQNTKLTVIKLRKTVSPNLLEMFFSAAPSLQEISMNEWFFRHLLEPQNRLRLVKKMYFCPGTIVENALYDEIGRNCLSGGLKLRKIDVNLESFLTDFRFSAQETQYRLIQALNRIFESSWDSLERICWYEILFFQGFKFPSKMPKVKEIKIRHSTEINWEWNSSLPVGFSWSKIFPGLIRSSITWSGSCQVFVKFFTSFILQPIITVRKVLIWFKDAHDKLEHLELIQASFPNAIVETEY